MKKYYPVPLHMHSVWERHASMEGHFYNAQKLGIHYMYITDHDIRMGRKQNHIDSFDFEQGIYVDEPMVNNRKRYSGFVREDPCHISFDAGLTDETCFTGTKCMKLTLHSDSSDSWYCGRVKFDTSQKRHEYALFAKVMLRLALKSTPLCNDTRIIIDVKLSQRPPQHKHASIRYVFGSSEGLKTGTNTLIPLEMPSPEWTAFDFDLLKDAAEVGGGDNVLQTVSIEIGARRGKSITLFVDDLKISWELEFERARQEQARLAAEIGKKYGITPFVTTEITGAGHHKISFSTKVPVMDYSAHNYNISHIDAINHVKKYGGIFSLNHPLEMFTKEKMTSRQKSQLVRKVTKEYIENKCYGASMMEVGFTEGRGGFSLCHHLELWDNLSRAGIFITGYGDSDNHTNSSSWFSGNNFVAYIGSENPSEESFIASMKKGDIYSGDPVLLHGDVLFFDDKGASFGSCVKNAGDSITVHLKITGIPDNCFVRFVADGTTVKREAAKGFYDGSVNIPLDKDINFIRAELYCKDRCIMLTNPIYYVNSEKIEIPEERLYK